MQAAAKTNFPENTLSLRLHSTSLLTSADIPLAASKQVCGAYNHTKHIVTEWAVC